jgi:2-oxoglutarate dehydrogenase complex dehydrogenase (E1) component-like enzyme
MFSKERLATLSADGVTSKRTSTRWEDWSRSSADLQDAGKESAERWHRIYCGSIGVEFMHIHFRDRCEWVTRRMEEAWREPNTIQLCGGWRRPSYSSVLFTDGMWAPNATPRRCQ